MKTMRLNRAESAAYTAGERRFWRAINRAQLVMALDHPQVDPRQVHHLCPYGKPEDRIILAERHTCGQQATITRAEVEQRNGRWGWVVEVVA
jgi:hypothetical protein